MMQAKLSEVQESRWLHPLLIFLGGLLIGIVASLPLGISWPYPVPPSLSICVNEGEYIRLGGIRFPFHCMAAYLFIQPLMLSSFLAAGALFGFIAQRLADRGSPGLAALIGGVTLFIAAFSGAQMVDRLPLPPNLPILQPSIAQPFAMVVFLISFIFTLAIGWVLHTPRLIWRALIAATVSGLTYMFIAYALYHTGPTPLAQLLPTAGRPMGNMMKTVVTSNLIAGTVGGWTILLLLSGSNTAESGPKDDQQT
jgi:hypothetical protein